MAKLIGPAFLLVLMPFALRAEVIDVDYEGSVIHIESDEPVLDFVLGQPIRGRMTIDTQLAGPDSVSSPGEGQYYNPGVDFVTGGVETQPFGPPGDRVAVQPWGPRENRYYQIRDRSVSDLDNESRFTLHIDRLGNEIGDDDIWQAFTAVPEEDGSNIWSTLSRIKNGVQSTVQFLFTRVSVTPRSCRAP